MSNFDIPKPVQAVIPEGYQFDPNTNQYVWVGIPVQNPQQNLNQNFQQQIPQSNSQPNSQQVSSQQNPSQNLQQNLGQVPQQSFQQQNPQTFIQQNQQFPVAGSLLPQIPMQMAPVEVKKADFLSKLKDFANTNFLKVFKKPFTVKEFWWVPTVAVVLILAILFGLVALFGSPKKTKSTDNIETKFSQTTPNLPLGNINTWILDINNFETVDMENISVELNLPQNYEFVSEGTTLPQPDISGRNFAISKIRSGESRKFLVKGKINAKIDDENIISGIIYYNLKNQPNKYIDLARMTTKTTSPEIKLELNPNIQAVENNGEVEWIAKIRNTRESDIQNIRIRFVYPNGNIFQYKSSSLVANNNYTDQKINPDNNTASDSIWLIDRLPGLGEYVLKVRGVLTGTAGNKPNFGVEASIRQSSTEYNPVSYASKDVEIISQPLIITTKIDGKDRDRTFKAGETINVSVYYQNNSKNTIRNLQIRGYVEDLSGILDLSTLKFIGGERGNVNNSKIEWQGTGVPQLVNLTPQGKGVLQYSIKVRDKDKFYNSERSQEKYQLIPRVEAFGTNQEAISYTDNIYKARSNMYFDQKVVQVQDPVATQANKRRYKVTWTATNEQNQVNNLVVSTVSPLPPSYWQKASVSDKSLSYNPENGEIIWKVQKLDSYSGMFGKPATISFELVVENQDLLFKEVQIQATDDVTNEVFNLKAQAGEI